MYRSIVGGIGGREIGIGGRGIRCEGRGGQAGSALHRAVYCTMHILYDGYTVRCIYYILYTVRYKELYRMNCTSHFHSLLLRVYTIYYILYEVKNGSV